MSEFPRWDSSDSRASLRLAAEFLREQAHSTFLKDGTHIEILFILDDEGTVQPQPIVRPLTREQISKVLREHIPDSSIYGLIYIAESWGYHVKGGNDHTAKQLHLGEMRVSDLDDKDRCEVLLVCLLSREGDSLAWADDIERKEDGTVSIAPSPGRKDIRFPLGDVFSAS